MQLILDKGLSTERKLLIDNVNEKPLLNIMTCSYVKILAKDEDFPAVDSFGDNRTFESVTIESNEKKVPIIGEYNLITDYSIQYTEESGRFVVSITLGKGADNG